MERRWDLEQDEDDRVDSRLKACACPWRGRAWLVAAVVACVALVGLFVARRFWPAQRGPQAGTAIRPSEKPPLADGLLSALPSPAGEAVSTSPDGPESLRREALEVAERLIEDLPDRPEPVALLALAYTRFGDSTEAVKCWQRCLELDPDFAGAYDGMGRIALEKGEFEEAAAHLRKALAMAPELSEVRTPLADALMRLGKIEEAVVVLEEDLELFPENVESLFRLGKAYQQLKEHEKAKEKFEAVIDVDPAYIPAYYGLTRVCASLGERDEAQKYREKFTQLKAADQEASDGRRVRVYRPERLPEAVASIYLAAGNVYSRQGDTWKAEARWSRAATLNPRDTVSRHQLALVYLTENRTAEAFEILGQLREIEPENAVHCLNLGFLNARLGQFDAAETAFRTACGLAPQTVAGYVALAQLYLQANTKLPEARTLAQTAVKLDPSASNYFLLSTACDRSGDAAGALSAIEKAVELNPDNAEYQRVYERIKGKR